MNMMASIAPVLRKADDLREYQRKDVNKILASLSKHEDPLYVLPTGGGKTQGFTHVTGEMLSHGWETAIFVHRKELLRQASRRLSSMRIAHGVIAPGFERTSHKVHVCSIDTISARFDRYLDWLLKLDLAIVDEAHHAVADNWDRILQLPKRRLGVTATPCRTDGRGLGETGLFSRMLKGPTIRELTDLGYLAPAQVYAPPTNVDLSSVKKRGGDFVLGQLADAVNVDEITQTAVRWYSRKCLGEPAVVFCTTVEHAKAVAEAFCRDGWYAQSVDGSMSSSARDRAINGLADGSVQVLTSCELIGEGLDIPAVSAAIQLRPTQSTGLFLQQIGRCLRPHEDKTRATILDLVGNSARHGMYDAERQWTLKGGLKGIERAVQATWRCRKCHRIHEKAEGSQGLKCSCGATQKGSGFVSATVDAHPPIGGYDAETLLRMQHKEVCKVLRSVSDLMAFGKLKGYSQPKAWAERIVKERDKYKNRFQRGRG